MWFSPQVTGRSPKWPPFSAVPHCSLIAAAEDKTNPSIRFEFVPKSFVWRQLQFWFSCHVPDSDCLCPTTYRPVKASSSPSSCCTGISSSSERPPPFPAVPFIWPSSFKENTDFLQKKTHKLHLSRKDLYSDGKLWLLQTGGCDYTHH